MANVNSQTATTKHGTPLQDQALVPASMPGSTSSGPIAPSAATMAMAPSTAKTVLDASGVQPQPAKKFLSHLATEDDVAEVKARMAQRAELLDEPVQPVFSKKFPGDKIQFLYTWLTNKSYTRIVNNPSYQDQLGKDPEAANRWFQIQVFQDCILWPSTFQCSVKEDFQPYPAGVIGGPTGLLECIMFSSGFTQDSAPDKVMLCPDEPLEPTKEEMDEIMQTHPLASQFGTAFEKPFFIRDFNYATNEYEYIPTRYYIYTQLDRATYALAKAETDDAAATKLILDACVLWPKNIDWDKEPANNDDWLFRSIMLASSFGIDPSTGIEEV